jgi:hypothetical protein
MMKLITLTPLIALALPWTISFAGDKANDTLTITSIPPGAQVEFNRKVIGTTPLTYKVGEYAFNVQKSSLFSKHLSTPVVIRVSKEGYIAREVTVTKDYTWHSINGQNHFVYYVITSNNFEINLDKIAAKPAAMTNADVIKMKEAGFSDELIIDKINNTPSAFNLEMDDLVALHKAGITDAVIQAMMHAR